MSVRSTEEIVARVEAVQATGAWLDFESPDLIGYLPFEAAKPFLKDGVKAEDWTPDTDVPPLDRARDYLPFAWEKANGNRGLSADRSVQHLRAWLWLAGYDVSADFDRRYAYYGKPCLVVASELTGFDWRSADDGDWTNTEGCPGLPDAKREALIADAKAFAHSLMAKSPALPAVGEGE